jgi:K+-sensing histidine kinase KdpD
VVNDLSDLTQVEAGTVELRDEIVDVAAVFREVAATAASALARDPETIAVESPGELPAVRGNKRRLVQLLLSLMHSPTPDGDGSTELAARADEDSLSLVVTHRGAAIPCQEMATLFDTFSPIEATEMLQDDGRRLRLGLARALATTLGGQLTVETLEDTGTVFTVTVPVVADVSAVA